MEEVSIEQYLSAIIDFTSTDEETQQRAHSFIMSFQQEERFLCFCYSARLLQDYSGGNNNVLQFCAIFIKNFLSITPLRGYDQIHEDWLFFESENKEEMRDVAKNACAVRLSDAEESLSNIAAACLALICEHDASFYDEFTLKQFQVISVAETIESVNDALSFFCELLQSKILFQNCPRNGPPYITALISEVPPMFFEEYDTQIRYMSLKLTFLLVELFPFLFNNEETITQMIQGVDKALATIDPSTQTLLYRNSFVLLFSIVSIYYDHADAFWELICPIVIDNLQCQIPPEAPHAPNAHKHLEPILTFWYKLAKLEFRRKMKNQKYHRLVKNSSEAIVPSILHLLIPSDSNDETIEEVEIETIQTSYYASIALEKICRVSKKMVFPIIFTMANDILADNNTGNLHAMLLAVAAVACEPPKKEFGKWIYDLAIQCFPNRFGRSPNPRMKETALYAIWRIISVYHLTSTEDFNILFAIIEENSTSHIKIRERCSAILKQICSVAPEDIIDAKFADIFEVVKKLSGIEIEDESQFLPLPISAFANVIQRCSQSDENYARFMEMIRSEAQMLFDAQTVPPQIVHTILVGALAKKLGKLEETNAFINCLLQHLDQEDLTLWEESLIAILNVLDTGKVDESNYEIVCSLVGRSQSSGSPLLVKIALRVIGKFISSMEPSRSDECDSDLQNMLQLLEENQGDEAILHGSILAVLEIARSFAKPSQATMEISLTLLRQGMAYPPCDQTSEIAQSIIVASTHIFYNLDTSYYYQYFLPFAKEIILYIEKLFKGNFITDDILSCGCGVLVQIGRKLQKKISHFLNRSKIIEFMNYGIESRSLEISKFAAKCKEEITSM